jgi:monoamine oxidase
MRVALTAPGIPLELIKLRGLGTPAAKKHVVIVGAGIAGLCAGYELERLGYEVTILEADLKHAGGRIRTLRFEGGRYGEAGAMRIPQDHNFTRFYCDELGLRLRPFVQVNHQGFLRVRGKKVRMERAAELRTLFELSPDEATLTDLDLWNRAIGALATRLSEAEQKDLYQERPQFYGSRLLDGSSLHRRLADAGLSEGAIQLLASTWNLETGVHFALCEHLREEIEGVWVEPFDEIEGGMDLLPGAIAAKLAGKIRFGAPVVAIAQDGAGVAAVFEQANGRHTVTGDWLLCTTPLGVLSRIEYRPGWSPKKADAIRRVNYDDATKVLALTRSRFWETNDGIFGGGSVSDGALGSTWYPADNAVTRSEDVSRAPSVLLASYSWGQTARRMAKNSSRETVLPELATLHDTLKSDPCQIEHLEKWSWADHPWSVGAYSFYHPGDQSELHAALVAPEGRVLLAGEHASLTHSWIQGGLQSAVRAATHIGEVEMAA